MRYASAQGEGPRGRGVRGGQKPEHNGLLDHEKKLDFIPTAV